MILLPAIDLFGGKAVRLTKGDYAQMTVYHDTPRLVAEEFKRLGAEYIHVVDLEGAKDGTTPNLDTVRDILSVGLPVEVGGGIRTDEVAERYLSLGVSRIILGTAAVRDRDFLLRTVKKWGEKVAVGVDIKDGKVAVSGWTETCMPYREFLSYLEEIGVTTVIVTDISKDGLLQGANHELYAELSRDYSLSVVASGGVSSQDDVKRLADARLYGAIVGKAYYTGAIDLGEAIKEAKR